MSSFNEVTINLENGALGRIATAPDGTAGLIIIGAVAVSGLALYTPKFISSLKDAEGLGITQAADATNDTQTWQQIKEFFDQAGNGAALWIYLCPNTLSQTDALDKTRLTNSARVLLNATQGSIRVLGVSKYMKPSLSYSPVIAHGIDPDVYTAITKAQELALEFLADIKPLVIIVDGRDFNGSVGDLTDLTTLTANKVGVALYNVNASQKNSSVGHCIGRIAGIPVQRSMARVKDGTMSATAYLNGVSVDTYDSEALELLKEKAYISLRYRVGYTGYFFNGDHTAVSGADDYLSIANNRVIHKVYVEAYKAYAAELFSEVDINKTDGSIATPQVKYLQNKLQNVLDTALVFNKEISSASVVIDPKQNVLSTGIIYVTIRVVPIGKGEQFVISLGFQNPSI